MKYCSKRFVSKEMFELPYTVGEGSQRNKEICLKFYERRGDGNSFAFPLYITNI